jgi:RNA polymerase sigma factor (sigma-70 family)
MPPPPAETFTSRLFLGPALRTQPDRRLVTLVREGYETAFEEIVRRYAKPLTRYAAAIVGSRGEDVTQDAFSKALLALRRDDAEIELRPWLFRIVRNTALNDLRDSPPTPELLAEAITGGEDPAGELEKREELVDLMRRLQSLPERQRAAIVMRELEGLSHEEIADALGLSDGAARQAIYRARQALRDGFAILLPLPLLRLLIDHGGDVAAAGAGAGAGGAAVAGGAVGGAGAGVALKAATATVLVAGAIGAGVAVQHDRHGGEGPSAAARSTTREVADSVPPTASRSLRATDSVDNSGSSGSSASEDRHGHGRRDESESGNHRGGSSHGGSGGGDRGSHGGFEQESGDGDGGAGRDDGDGHGGRSGGGGPGPSGGGDGGSIPSEGSGPGPSGEPSGSDGSGGGGIDDGSGGSSGSGSGSSGSSGNDGSSS